MRSATEAEAIYAKAAKERQRASLRKGDKPPSPSREGNGKGESADKAGADLGISGATVERCLFVKKNGVAPLADAVRRGKLLAKTAADFAISQIFQLSGRLSLTCLGRLTSMRVWQNVG